MTDPDPVDVELLPPTQYLVLEVLAARHRTGEHMWTLPAVPAVTRAVNALARHGLIGVKGGNVPRTHLAWLTDFGRRSTLDPAYCPPNTRREVT